MEARHRVQKFMAKIIRKNMIKYCKAFPFLKVYTSQVNICIPKPYDQAWATPPCGLKKVITFKCISLKEREFYVLQSFRFIKYGYCNKLELYMN